MISSRSFLFFLLGVVCLSFCACSGINTVSSRVNTTTGTSSLGYTQIGDVFLNDQVKIEDIAVLENQMPRIFKVKLKDVVWFKIAVEVKMDFYDEDGAKLDNPWGWKPVTLEGGQDDWVQFMAPNNHARNFKLYIQKAGN